MDMGNNIDLYDANVEDFEVKEQCDAIYNNYHLDM
jgi:hypothetical protein